MQFRAPIAESRVIENLSWSTPVQVFFKNVSFVEATSDVTLLRSTSLCCFLWHQKLPWHISDITRFGAAKITSRGGSKCKLEAIAQQPGGVEASNLQGLLLIFFPSQLYPFWKGATCTLRKENCPTSNSMLKRKSLRLNWEMISNISSFQPTSIINEAFQTNTSEGKWHQKSLEKILWCANVSSSKAMIENCQNGLWVPRLLICVQVLQALFLLYQIELMNYCHFMYKNDRSLVNYVCNICYLIKGWQNLQIKIKSNPIGCVVGLSI